MDLAGKEKAFLRGYKAGYLDGVAAGQAGNCALPEIMALPVEALGLSARAINSLQAWGCVRVADVAAMTAEAIYSVPNLGKLSANEIARSLYQNGIFPTAWDAFLR